MLQARMVHVDKVGTQGRERAGEDGVWPGRDHDAGQDGVRVQARMLQLVTVGAQGRGGQRNREVRMGSWVPTGTWPAAVQGHEAARASSTTSTPPPMPLVTRACLCRCTMSCCLRLEARRWYQWHPW